MYLHVSEVSLFFWHLLSVTILCFIVYFGVTVCMLLKSPPSAVHPLLLPLESHQARRSPSVWRAGSSGAWPADLRYWWPRPRPEPEPDDWTEAEGTAWGSYDAPCRYIKNNYGKLAGVIFFYQHISKQFYNLTSIYNWKGTKVHWHEKL